MTARAQRRNRIRGALSDVAGLPPWQRAVLFEKMAEGLLGMDVLAEIPGAPLRVEVSELVKGLYLDVIAAQRDLPA